MNCFGKGNEITSLDDSGWNTGGHSMTSWVKSAAYNLWCDENSHEPLLVNVKLTSSKGSKAN
jgi:hypothetical protein